MNVYCTHDEGACGTWDDCTLYILLSHIESEHG